MKESITTNITRKTSFRVRKVVKKENYKISMHLVDQLFGSDEKDTFSNENIVQYINQTKIEDKKFE